MKHALIAAALGLTLFFNISTLLSSDERQKKAPNQEQATENSQTAKRPTAPMRIHDPDPDEHQTPSTKPIKKQASNIQKISQKTAPKPPTEAAEPVETEEVPTKKVSDPEKHAETQKQEASNNREHPDKDHASEYKHELEEEQHTDPRSQTSDQKQEVDPLLPTKENELTSTHKEKAEHQDLKHHHLELEHTKNTPDQEEDLRAPVLETASPSYTPHSEGYEGNSEEGDNWSYDGETGPEFWANLSPDFILAKTGKSQSPIDITDSLFSVTLKPLAFSYSPSMTHLSNNGHTIQFHVKSDCQLHANQTDYKLEKFRFHSPSEHTVNSKHYAMEIQFVHRDGNGSLAIVGVFVKEGRPNDMIKALWKHVPIDPDTQETVQSLEFDIAKLLPKDLNYYSYEGSITTPPCTEGVQWYLISEPIEASVSQIEKFRAIIPPNNRPTQPIFSRIVRRIP
ncbi:MAG: carbonic anhydrase family protein [Verrucomicrobiota bacterium]